MKMPLLMLLCLCALDARSQVVHQSQFSYPPLATAKDFTGKVGRAELPAGWPEVDGNVRVSEVRFDRGAMTRWHRHKGSQYLIATGGAGVMEYFRADGTVATVKITVDGKVFAPGNTCHRHGSDGSTERFSHMFITLGATYWDDCDRGYRSNRNEGS